MYVRTADCAMHVKRQPALGLSASSSFEDVRTAACCIKRKEANLLSCPGVDCQCTRWQIQRTLTC